MEDDPGGLWSYGFKEVLLSKDLQWFILSVLRQSDLRDFQSIMLLTAKSSPADLWVYMGVSKNRGTPKWMVKNRKLY